MRQNITSIICAGLLLFIGASVSFAQNGAKYKVGEVVEAHSYFFNPPWHKAQIVTIGGGCASSDAPYRVHFVGDGAGDHGDPCIGEDEIRALAGEKLPADDAQTVGGNTAQPVNRGGGFNIGDRVDVIYSYNKDKGKRGTIVEAAGGRYKVRYDGCEAYRDAFVEPEALHPAATISADALDIKFLIGKWATFTPSYPNTVANSGTIYREYGPGAKAPPLVINADGTYVWYFDYGKPPVRDQWTSHAKIEGTKYGTEMLNGVIIKDPKGAEWKVYRWKPEGEKEDHITAQTMCSGMTVTGTRIQ